MKFWAAVGGVILGPVLAMFISHVFSAGLARQGRTVVFGLILGLVVLALQVILQPGHASLVD